jgi:hypothetical protein
MIYEFQTASFKRFPEFRIRLGSEIYANRQNGFSLHLFALKDRVLKTAGNLGFRVVPLFFSQSSTLDFLPAS